MGVWPLPIITITVVLMTDYSANIFWMTSCAGTVLGTEAVSMRKTDASALLALVLVKRERHNQHLSNRAYSVQILYVSFL